MFVSKLVIIKMNTNRIAVSSGNENTKVIMRIDKSLEHSNHIHNFAYGWCAPFHHYVTHIPKSTAQLFKCVVYTLFVHRLVHVYRMYHMDWLGEWWGKFIWHMTPNMLHRSVRFNYSIELKSTVSTVHAITKYGCNIFSLLIFL